MVEKAAAAIANARGGRRGAPPVSNVLELLQSLKSTPRVGNALYDEVMEDARAALEAVGLGLADPIVRTAELTPEERKLLYYFAGYLRAALGLSTFDRRLFALTSVFVQDFNGRAEETRAEIAKEAEKDVT